jgi:hypothetical protein
MDLYINDLRFALFYTAITNDAPFQETVFESQKCSLLREVGKVKFALQYTMKAQRGK